MAYILLAMLLLTIYFSSKLYGNMFNPISVFLGVNLVSLILMYGLSGLNNELSLTIWIVIIIMFVSYLVGVCLGSFKYRLSSKKESKVKKTSRQRLIYLLVVYCVIYNISAFCYLWKLDTTYGLFSFLSKLAEMNVAFQAGEFNIGIITHFLPLAYTISLLVLYHIKYYGGNMILYIQYILCYIPAISPRRDTLFYLIFMSLVFVFMTSKKASTDEELKKYFKIFSISSIALWLMSVSQSLLNKASESNFRLFNLPIPASLNDSVIYIAGNYPYLQKLYDFGQVNFYYFLISTLRIVYKYIFLLFGLSIDTTNIFDLPLYNVGSSHNFLFNTAPLVYYFIKESGVFFFIGFIILGLVTQKLHNRFVSNKSAGNLLLASYAYFIVFFSFRSYNLIYLSTVLMLLYMLIAYFVIEVEKD
ncbi:O-antigen polymerase [Streptococcus jiangjianxini]|uniref:O-antigen polymerase n=1 Tax=Streptococcus jiangjianxini TaxID=3161189 RepID=UPI0032EAF155